MTRHVLISCLHLQRTINQYLPIFQEHNITIETPEIDQQLKEDELMKIIDRFDGVIAGDDQFTASVLHKAKKLKIISKWGIGIDGIDCNEAQHLGIRITNTPSMFSDEVADVVIGYIILLSRHLHTINQNVRRVQWNETQIPGISLSGKTLGVIGVGNIGRAVIRRAAALGMNVLGYDIYPPPEAFLKETRTKVADLHEIYSHCDFISLNCNLTEQNYHMLNKDAFSQMKQGVFIVNTSRGPLIDEEALIQALKEKRVAGAALDVFETEPLPENSPLRNFDNCIFGCHNSSNTKEAVLRVNELAIHNLIEGLETARP
jgi:D-3-phosphoglycerate dehydrogenase / 2-oxoglutarate reductase